MDLISHVKQEILANEGRPSVFFDNADVLKEGSVLSALVLGLCLCNVSYISLRSRIRAVDQNLRFGGQELLYGQTLEHYNIQNLSFLDLDIRIILHLQFRNRSEILRDVNLNQTGGQIKTMVAALGRHAQGPGYHEFRLLLNANQLNYKTQTTLGAMGANDRSVLILRKSHIFRIHIVLFNSH
jgi:Ubiquitin family